MRLGLIADTHGRLRSGVHDVFAQVDRILHAGDVGDGEVLDELALLAPVTAVYGNVDGGTLRHRLPRVAEVEIDGFRFVVTHGDQFGSPEPDALKAAFPDADVIVFGHTHRALIRDLADFTVVVNPGAAGPRRFDLKPSVAIMETEPGIPPRARIVPLD
ncbi:MAG TPA: metallophosphoesterase family protein [Gemmatimonadales bacterium]|nr:metallophosphoesterase family protein [Gemmatimonadales bacterium]